MKDSNDPNSQETSVKMKRHPMKDRSMVWDHFDKFTNTDDTKKARCKYYGNEYCANSSSNDTSSLNAHLKVCKQLPLSGESKKTQLSLEPIGENEGILKKWFFDQKVSRHKLAYMVIIDELPFRFVEGEGFINFMRTTQPFFKVPSRFSVARDCYQIYLEEKKNRFASRGCDFLKEKYMHMRCIAHIANLIVNDGLQGQDSSVGRVRKAVRFVRQSPTRIAKFKECIDFTNANCKSLLCLDVKTRWNSIYLMLKVAQKFQHAFELFEGMNPYYLKELNEADGVPTSWDWGNVKRLIDILVHFYELTLRIFGSLYIISNIFYHQISNVNCLLKEWISNDDVEVQMMGKRMKEKYDKYWGDVHKMNKLIYVAIVVDPRYKLEFIEFALCEEYGKYVGWKLASDTSLMIRELFEEYKNICQTKSTQVNQEFQSSSISSSINLSTSSRTQSTLGAGFMRQKMESGEVKFKCELDVCHRESVYVTKDNDEFDILKWRKVNSSRFPILAQLARDVFSWAGLDDLDWAELLSCIGGDAINSSILTCTSMKKLILRIRVLGLSESNSLNSDYSAFRLYISEFLDLDFWDLPALTTLQLTNFGWGSDKLPDSYLICSPSLQTLCLDAIELPDTISLPG
ncbi:zinc finger BED domain-containing protein RICESLEEPER 2-like [Apium graveolens]|uniref:zinc finger BED domain-containing protein RICESLEEPER 2-like n=1 Tax=Apium graveolens TaxID=4045 RepID=UPI003D7B9950